MAKSIISGVSFTSLKEISDDRGAVLHMLRNDSPDFRQFGECYFSEVFPGAVKAWKLHSLQTQNLAVPIGRLKIVLFDKRESFDTYGKIEILEMGRPDKYFRILIPPGICYGFKCISTDKALIVNCADLPHTRGESLIYPIDSNEIPFSWDEKI
jgi:dTDP-4-dehydrorhamnose 3,5-epimerase